MDRHPPTRCPLNRILRALSWRGTEAPQLAAGIEPLRRLYDLRHTFTTFAFRAGISTFDFPRYIGASLTMIDRPYGHLARDGREHAIRLPDELSAGQRPRWTLVDAAWTSTPTLAARPENGNMC